MRAICIYAGCTKATTNNQDIRSSVTIKSLFTNISWMIGCIHTIKLVLESVYQSISENILLCQPLDTKFNNHTSK